MSVVTFRVGREQRVGSIPLDTELASQQVTHLSNGGWVVTWTSADADESLGIYQQYYNRYGQPQFAGDRLVNITTDGHQSNPSVTALADGGWLVTWTSEEQDGSGYGIYQQRYNANGQPQYAVDEKVNITTADHQALSSVTSLRDGWIVTWQSYNHDGSGVGIYQQRYNENGQAQFAEDKKVNLTTADNQTDASVTALADGGWLVTWTSANQDGSSTGIYQQRYNNSGQPQYKADSLVNTTTLGSQVYSTVTALADGGWVITWVSDTGGSGSDIYQQRYNSEGDPQGPKEQRVNGIIDKNQSEPSVAALADGGWVVTWTSENAQDSSDTDIYQQRYNANGQPQYTQDQIVNSTTGGKQILSSVTALADGGWVVTWISKDASGSYVYQQRYELNKAPQDIVLNGFAVQELAGNGTLVGTLSAIDPNLSQDDGVITYELIDSAGGRFAIVNNQLVVADGARLDYEQAASHVVTVRVTDKGQASFVKNLVITVTDVAPEYTLGTAGNDVLKASKTAKVKDNLKGGFGDDQLWGGYGNDTLTGDAGKDAFVFHGKLGTSKTDRKVNFDTIRDFKVKDDSIWLDNAVFKKLGKKGSEEKPAQLKKAYFTIGDKAKDSNDYIIYNKKKGILYYDPDGSGAKQAIEFAKLSKNLKMTYKDFFVI